MDFHSSRGSGSSGSRSRHREADDGDSRYRERSGDRDRSRSPSPGRRPEREWDRGKRRYSPTYSRFEEAREHDYYERRPFNEEPPSKTVMLRGLPQMAFEAEIRHALDPQVSGFVDIRVPRSLEGGNRGFGFVEFANVETASAWMEQVQGAMFMNGQRVVAHFCEDREMFQKRDDRPPLRPAKTVTMPPADWECSRCGCNNFRHRATCFRCEALRSEAEIVSVPSADDQVGLSPCNTLLLRNLDSGTEETKIIQALLNVIPTSGIRNAKIMRDPRSQQSVGFGFVQFKTQHDCTEMYNCLMRINPPLTIDGKQAAISFAKQPLNEIIAPPPHQTPFPNSSYNQTPSAPPRTGYGQANDVNSAAAVAQMALQQLHRTQMSASIVQQHMHNQHHGGIPSSYQYDPSSGYYYDPHSQLYYDPNTQYFWNPQTQQFLMWNPHSQSYVVVQQALQPGAQHAAQMEPSSAPVEEKQKLESEKERQAKKIVQDMEKWAKTMNQKQPLVQRKTPVVPEVKVGGVASVFKEVDEEEQPATENQRNSQKSFSSSVPGPANSVVASNDQKGKRSASHENDDIVTNDAPSAHVVPASAESTVITRQQEAEKKMVDWEKFACLLCKRQLQSKDLLQKHLEMSDLHLRNLDVHRRQTLTEEEIEELEAQERDSKYRDRAKERRKKYGESEPAPPLRGATAAAASASRKRDAFATENEGDESGSAGLGSDNVGAKLMKAMGWAEGKGLGKTKQGIVDPVEARGHSGTAGLGLTEGAPDILPTDTYANKVRKTMRNRFRQMHE